MFKIGDRVKVQLTQGEHMEYGVVFDVCAKTGAISIAIGKVRTVQVRACDVAYDEGYSRLKQEKYS